MSPETRTILVVEDDTGIATLQRRRLERAGYAVRVASSVDEALAALATASIDLVVLDYRLGETTGLDLHRRMKASGVEVPVILVSAAIEDAAVVEALRAGVRDIVVKTPDYLDYLPEAVRGVLNQAAVDLGRSRQQQGTRVLVVEDDPGTATLERRRLERAGYRVTLAATAREAMEVVRGGDVSLAVIDLRLPDTSGLELFEQWKAEGLAIPAILVTGFADQAVAIRALRAGIRDFVPKSGDFVDYLPTAVDRVAAQVRVERKLADSELRLASIVGTTLDAILMCDDQTRIVLFNRAAEDLFGCAAADTLGQPLGRFIPGLALGDATSRGRLRERRELDGVRADGRTLPIEISATDVIISNNRLFTVIARDISERRRAEAEMREADRRKDEFLGMLAHELRNPLAAVMTAGEVLHRTVPDVPAAQKLISVVRRQTRALSRMVDDLLDVSRVTLGKIQLTKEPLLFGEVVSRAIESTRDAAARAGLQVVVRMDSDPLWLLGDLTRLEQVVTNLLTNAIKFTAAGGTISVTLEGRGGREAILRVRDTGIGMPSALLPRVFDLFVQGDTSLDRSRSGLGIGLALVRQIILRHGGTVNAASEGPGRGSEFVVRLPLSSEDVRPMTDAPGRGAGGSRRISVLVVDDQRDVADSMAMLIEALGHRARAVYDGAEALAISRQQAPDAMFVDIGMPGMTGYELAEHVRRDPALADLQLVAVTGYAREEDRARVVRAGFDLHMTKPVTDADLHAVLAAMASSATPR